VNGSAAGTTELPGIGSIDFPRFHPDVTNTMLTAPHAA